MAAAPPQDDRGDQEDAAGAAGQGAAQSAVSSPGASAAGPGPKYSSPYAAALRPSGFRRSAASIAAAGSMNP